MLHSRARSGRDASGGAETFSQAGSTLTAAAENGDDAASIRSGILLIVTALALAALSGALMKLLTADMSPALIAWFRFAGYFLIILPFALQRAGTGALKPPRMKVQILRGLFLVIGNISFMLGVVGLDYANAIAILYVYPFLMTLMAPAILGERVAPAGWLGVAGGFLGVLIVIRPDPTGLDHHALFVLATGFLVALQMLLNRKLGVVADPAVVSMWGALTATLTLTLALPWSWTPIGMEQIGIIVLMAVATAGSQTMMILAMARAPASRLAPFTYSEIVAAVLIALVVFGTLPDMLAWSGIGLIILSGIMVARAEGKMTFRRQPKI